jgi:hypothetical protein
MSLHLHLHLVPHELLLLEVLSLLLLLLDLPGVSHAYLAVQTVKDLLPCPCPCPSCSCIRATHCFDERVLAGEASRHPSEEETQYAVVQDVRQTAAEEQIRHFREVWHGRDVRTAEIVEYEEINAWLGVLWINESD